MNMNKLTYWVAGILIAVLGSIWASQYSKLVEIEKALLDLKIEVVKMQSQMIDRDEVEKICEDILLKHGIK